MLISVRNERLTLAQNYRKLGLTARLNAHTGDIEKAPSQVAGLDNIASSRHDPFAIVSSTSKTNIVPREVQVERDPTTGAILKISDPSWERINPLNDPLDDLSDEETISRSMPQSSTKFIQELEEQASIEAPKKGRRQSQKEQGWLQELVDKHGHDYGKMMRDRKLNVYQLSEGDIKNRIKKWMEATATKEGPRP